MNLIKVFLIAWLMEITRSDQVLGETTEADIKCLKTLLNMCQKYFFNTSISNDELTELDSFVNLRDCRIVSVNSLKYLSESENVTGACAESSFQSRLMENVLSIRLNSRKVRAVTLYPETSSSIDVNQKWNSDDDFLHTVYNGSTLFDVLLRDFPSIFETPEETITEDDPDFYSDLTEPISEALSENEDLILEQFQEEGVFSYSSTEFSTIPNVISYASSIKPQRDKILNQFESSSNSSNQTQLTKHKGLGFSMKEMPNGTLNSSDLLVLFRSRYPVENWKSLGFFTEDYLQLINKHWLQFSPPFPSSHYILAGVYTLVMIIGVTGNSLVIFMFLRCRSLRTPANVLVMNLAVSDFFLLAKMPVCIYNSIHFGPALGAMGCQVYGFLGGLTGTVSIMTLAAIALDRYYVIVYPLDPLRRTTRQRAKACVLLVWFYGSIFASLPLTNNGFSRYVPEGYLTSCSFDYLDQSHSNKVFILSFFFAAWVVPFSIITFCYSRIYRAVISGSSGASSRRGQEQEKRKTEIRLAGVVIGVVGLWFVAWTPYAVVALLGVSGNARLISPLSSMIPAIFCKTASCLDPYIYAVTHPRFRREFEKFFCRGEARRRKLEMIHGRTQCWKTETSQIQGIVIGIQQRRNDSFSEEEIEEMVVMIDNRLSLRKTNSNSSAQLNLCEIPFPPDLKAAQKFQHPSWFASPFSRKNNRSSSLKMKPIKSQNNSQSEPISV